jgi:two-component system, chemotaxis family, CheB/CheR fusion protein
MAASKKQSSPKRGRKLRPSAPPRNTLAKRPIIVGIGASAGGLEAFEKFFSAMPSKSGMGFVLVPHLDPAHESMMVGLLKSHTRMDVVQAEDGMKVLPDRVHVIPPNRNMGIVRGLLHLSERSSAPGAKTTIDFFLRSLAEDLGDRAVGVILSGTGSDGTLGLKAVKAQLGMVMVQDPASAKYAGMPQSAISTRLVDDVLPAEEMPGRLMAYARKFAQDDLPDLSAMAEKSPESLQKIFLLLRNQTGHDFSLYKKNTVYRRLWRRMNIRQIDSISGYARFLEENPQEIGLFFKELLIGVTRFFRDAEAFQHLKKKVVPLLLEQKNRQDPVRIWVPACSGGEEVYSIAILLKEHMEESKKNFKVQVFGTDIDKTAIETARLGVFPTNIVDNVSPERLKRFFIKEDDGYRISKDIREMAIFAPHDVLKDPPFTRLDLLSCRNLLIYFDGVLQKKLLPLFHYSLRPGGVLFLGPSESAAGFEKLFVLMDKKWKFFKRKEALSPLRIPLTVHTPSPMNPLRIPEDVRNPRESGLPETIRKILEENYTPACVVIDESGNILHIQGRTGKYLEFPSGQASVNILEHARQGLRMDLSIAIRKAATQRKSAVIRDLWVKTNGSHERVDVTARPLPHTKTGRGLIMVLFKEADAARKKEGPGGPRRETDKDGHVKALEKELKNAKESLRTTVDDLATANEELKSSNEEMQSTNEELQSSNEELETSKEELQSLNEELSTVNAELQERNETLSSANDDMKNLFQNTRIPMVFLDQDLRIRRFTPATTDLIHLIPTDVGRPLKHTVSNLKLDDLSTLAAEVLKTLISKDTEVETKDGRWHLMRITPYQTGSNMIDGLVISFVDVNELHAQKEKALTLNRELAEAVKERRQAEEEVRRLNKDLEKKVSERTQELESFCYSISHDLRTPLRGIEGFSHILLKEGEGKRSPTENDYLERIRTASRRMAHTIDGLLALSRLARIPMTKHAVDLSGMAREIVETLRTNEPNRRVEFVCADGLTAEGDAKLLRTALQNLLENAWKFTGKKADARIEFGLTKDPGKTVYFIGDNGSGFDMTFAGKLFRAFERLHHLDEFPGTGIGLALVHRIIRRHGGDIWARAAVDDGATFYFTLPILP